MGKRGRARFWKRWGMFALSHWQPLLFLLLFLSGFAAGCIWYLGAPALWETRLSYYVTADRAGDGWWAVGGFACLVRWVPLTVLLAASVSVYGLPFVMAVPFVYGGYVGIAECLWYQTGAGGIWLSLWQVVIPSLLQVAVLLAACAQAARMTAALAGQLLPGTTRGSLWPYWRLCMLRFLLFFGISAVSALLEATARMCF